MSQNSPASDTDQVNPTRAEAVIGAKIKECRLARRQTLQALAQRTGLSRSFLSKLENGKVSPSIPTLLRIGDALDTTLSTLLDGLTASGGEKLVTVRASQRRTVAYGGASFGYGYERLAHRQNSVFEAFVVCLTRGRRPPKPFVHSGPEFNYVLSGRVELVYGKQHLTLEVGDSVYYDGSVPHYSVARGRTNAQLLAILVTGEPLP